MSHFADRRFPVVEIATARIVFRRQGFLICVNVVHVTREYQFAQLQSPTTTISAQPKGETSGDGRDRPSRGRCVHARPCFLNALCFHSFTRRVPNAGYRARRDRLCGSTSGMRNKRALRVLIADDDRDTVMTLGILLRSEAIDVRLATGGSEVPALVEEFRPDAVLLDIAMPDRSGLLVALELKGRYGPRCPVLIAVTAHNTEAAKRLTAKGGFQHHVAKPYDPDHLVKLLASIEPANW